MLINVLNSSLRSKLIFYAIDSGLLEARRDTAYYIFILPIGF